MSTHPQSSTPVNDSPKNRNPAADANTASKLQITAAWARGHTGHVQWQPSGTLYPHINRVVAANDRDEYLCLRAVIRGDGEGDHQGYGCNRHEL